MKKKKRKIKSRIAGQQLTTRAWQTLPCFFFVFFLFCFEEMSRYPEPQGCPSILLSCSVQEHHKINEDVFNLEVLKMERKK